MEIINTNCTWSIALHHLVKYQIKYQKTNTSSPLGEVIVGFDTDGKEVMLNTIKVADTANQTKDGMDFGSGEIVKSLNTIKVADTAPPPHPKSHKNI